MYFPYDDVVKVFRRFGIDASSEEGAPLAELEKKVAAYARLSPEKKKQLSAALLRSQKAAVIAFIQSLENTILRQIERIIILALHGESYEVTTVDAAVRFIESYADSGKGKPVERFEIQIRYNNGNEVKGSFRDKVSAIEFLKTYEPMPPRVA